MGMKVGVDEKGLVVTEDRVERHECQFRSLREYLIHHRNINGLSMQALANMVGKSQTTIYDLERGKTVVRNVDLLNAIAKALPTMQVETLEYLYLHSLMNEMIERRGIDRLTSCRFVLERLPWLM